MMYIHSKIGIFGVTAEKMKSITSWKGKTAFKESVYPFQWYDLFLDETNFLISTILHFIPNNIFPYFWYYKFSDLDHKILATIKY